MTAAGFPMDPIEDLLRGIGKPAPRPPSEDASREEVMRALWRDAGLEGIETRTIAVERRFADFDAYWASCLAGARVGPVVAALPPAQADALKASLKERMKPDADGSVCARGRANAVKGRLPG